MRKIFLNIINMAPQNVSVLVLIVCASVWAIVWAVMIFDILGRQKSGVWKAAWLTFGSVPVAGGVLYALFELLTADWKSAFSWRQHDAKTKPKAGAARPR